MFEYPASNDKDSLTLRSIHVPLADGTTEYLVTNVMSHQLNAEKFFELYSMRWGIESKYREFKNRFKIESFNSIKTVSIRQEFFAVMYLSNLSAIAKKEADYLLVLDIGNKHSYQTNRRYILNRIKYNIVFLLKASANVCDKKIFEIINEASKVLSIVRPNRKFGRYRKHTRRRYYNHMKSCI